MEFYVAPGSLKMACQNGYLVWQIKTPGLFGFEHGFSSASVKKVVGMIEDCSGKAKDVNTKV